MLANMLDAPISKLAVGDNVNAGKYLFDTGTLVKWLVRCFLSWQAIAYLVFLETVLEDVLNDKTTSLT
jgi:hypothetical protein